jgi:hypothetical protein
VRKSRAAAAAFLINGVERGRLCARAVRWNSSRRGQTLSSIHYARQRAKERTAAQKYKSNVQLRDHFNWTIKRAASAHRDVRVHSLI